MAIWNRSLSQGKVNELYNNGEGYRFTGQDFSVPESEKKYLNISLFSYYSGDYNDVEQLIDSSGSERHGNITNYIYQQNSCALNSCYEENGVGSITINSLDMSNDFTFQFWINFSEIDG